MNKLGVNFSIFVLFFSIALIDALRQHNWIEVFIFLALGALFVWGDFVQRKK